MRGRVKENWVESALVGAEGESWHCGVEESFLSFLLYFLLPVEVLISLLPFALARRFLGCDRGGGMAICGFDRSI